MMPGELRVGDLVRWELVYGVGTVTKVYANGKCASIEWRKVRGRIKACWVPVDDLRLVKEGGR